MRVYLAAPAHHAPTRERTAVELRAAGYEVTTASPSPVVDVDALVIAVERDLAALVGADALVTVGDCSELFETAIAGVYGIPTVAADATPAELRDFEACHGFSVTAVGGAR